MERAARQRSRELQLGPSLVDFQKSAGLEGVSETVYPIPYGTWMEDGQARTIGAKVMLNALSGMQGFSMAMFTKVLGWEVPDMEKLLVQVERDFRDDGLRKVMDMYVVYGRKPVA